MHRAPTDETTGIDPADELADEFLGIDLDSIEDARERRGGLADGSDSLDHATLEQQRTAGIESALRDYLRDGAVATPTTGCEAVVVRTDDRGGPVHRRR